MVYIMCVCEREREGEREKRERRSRAIYHIQVRGQSNFSSVGEWSEPEILILQRVPPPTNVQITAPIRDVSRIQSGNNLIISGLSIPLTWTPPSDLAEINGYDVIISREAVDQRYAAPSGDHAFNSEVSACRIAWCSYLLSTYNLVK